MDGADGRIGIPEGRAVRAAGPASVRVLGAWRLPDRALLAARVGAVEVVIDARPAGAAASPFYRTMRGTDVRVFRRPADPGPGRAENLAVDRLIVQYLDRDPLQGGTSPVPETPRPEDVPGSVPLPPGMRIAAVRRLADALEAEVSCDAPGTTASVRWSRDPGEASFMGVGVSGRRAGDWDPRLAAALDGWAAGVASAVASVVGMDAHWDAEAPTRTLFADLGRPLPEGFPHLSGTRPSRIAVHVQVPSRCVQRCVFCPVATGPEPDPGDTRAVEDALVRSLAGVVRSGIPVDLVLVGDDALNVADPVGLVRRLSAFGPAHVQIVTPGTRLADPALARGVAGLVPRPSLTLSLLGPDAATHDALAGCPGAFDTLVASIATSRAAGLDLRVNVVVVAPNAVVLDRVVARAAGLGVPVRLVLFHSDPGHPPALLRANLPAFDVVAASLRRLDESLLDAVVEVVDVPLCVLPPTLRGRAVFAAASLPDPAVRRPAACTRCPASGTRCPGPTRGAVDFLGEAGLEPLPE